MFGRFEMCARIDTRPGLWPAFWTLGINGSWPHNGEVDIMEFYDDTILANVAWGAEEKWQPHYIIINLAIGGTSGGDPSNTIFPARYEIDYIRVYQK